MSGPTLALNITASGQAQVDALAKSVATLGAALGGIPAASAEIQKLSKALSSASQPAGLSKGAGDLKDLVGEFKILGAQLNTSFLSLEETIKKGWGKAAKAQAEGEASLRTGSKRGRTVPSTGADGGAIEVPLAWFGKMQAGAEKVNSGMLALAEREALTVNKSMDLKKAAEAQRVLDLKMGSLKLNDAILEAAFKEATAINKSIERNREAAFKEATAINKSMDLKKAAEAQRILDLKTGSLKLNDAILEAAFKEATAINKGVDVVIAAQKAADARYAAMSLKGQAKVVLGARSALDQQTPVATVAQTFGPTAMHAAQATTFASAMAAVHGKAAQAHAEAGRGAPKFKALGVAMSDAHSAARGLASGFGAMYLTWGHIGPLLAGAAISQSFVTSIKLGVEARQHLEVLKVLSQETEQSVAGLEAQMGSLARTGPFGPTKVAEAMKVLSLAGLEVAEVSKAIKPALDFAIAGGLGIEKSAETLVAVGTAYGYTANQFSLVSDAITKAAAISMSSVDSMAESFRSSTMIAQAYGVTLKDTATGLALLANVGIRGSSAGVALRQMYSELSGASKVTREAMKRLGVEVLDNEGKMKDLLTVAEALSKGLEKYSGKGRVRAIQDISNERGGKGLIAVVSAVEAEVVDKLNSIGLKSGVAFEKGLKEGMTDKFRLIRDQMDEMAGFAATAAARLSSTPDALLKGVKASFEQSLVDAFKALEPTLIVLSVRLREVFNSPEFVSGVTTLVKSVGSLTTVLFESVGALKALGVGFLVYKAAQVALLTMELMSAVMATSAVRTGLAALGFTGMGVAAAAATPAVVGLAAATGVLSATLKVAGPLAVFVTLAALAWQTYAKHNEDARKVAVEADRQRTGITLDALKAEADRLHAINVEIAKGETAHYAEAKAKEESAKQSRRLAFDKARAPLAEATDAARAKLDKEQKRIDSGGGNSFAMPGLEKGLADALYRQGVEEGEFNRTEKALVYEAARVRGESLKAEGLRLAPAKKTRPQGKPWDAGATGPSAAPAELSVDRATYQGEMARAAKEYAHEKKLLDERHKYKLITDVEYAFKSEAIAEAHYARDLRTLEKFVQDSKAQLAILAAEKDPKKLAKSEKETLGISGALTDAEDELRRAKASAAVRLEGSGKALSRGTEEDLAKLTVKVGLDAESLRIARLRVDLAPSEVAALEAVSQTQAAGAAAMLKLQDALKQTKLALSERSTDLSHLMDPENDPLIQHLSAEAKRLSALIVVYQAEIDKLAITAGETAKGTASLKAAPKSTWRENLKEWQDAVGVLNASRDDFMNGWVDRGRTMWGEFLKTGKLSMKSLGDLMMQTLADMTYKRFIAQPFAKAGEALFEGLFNPKPAGPDLMGINPDSGTAQALQDLRIAAGDLGTSFMNLGQSAWKMLLDFAAGLQASAAANGGGAGGWMSAIGGLFKGGGGSNIPAGSDVIAPVASAYGNAFDRGVLAFAQGGVVDRPQYFKFGKGGANLGVMGEAGPEAILPLARGADGNLGVRSQGNSGTTNVTVASKTSVVIENHSGGPEPEVQTQTQPNGDEMIRVVIKAAARDMSTGGPLRKATRSSGSLPRY